MSDEGKIYAGQRPYPSPVTKGRSVRLPPSENRHWLRKLLLGLLLAVILVSGWFKLTNPATLPIHQVKINGHFSHIDSGALRQTILPFVARGFLGIDTSGLQDRLQQLPWVYSATVKRVWPDTVIIEIVEQRAIARFNDNTLLNQYGDLFTVESAQMPVDLPFFIGSAGQQVLMWQTYQKLTALLAPLGLKITVLGLDARQSWRLQLSNSIVLLLGKTDPEERLHRFITAYSQVVGSKAAQINYIDLRYPHGMAVGLKQ